MTAVMQLAEVGFVVSVIGVAIWGPLTLRQWRSNRKRDAQEMRECALEAEDRQARESGTTPMSVW